ncbi:MAG TPA: 4-hydroxyphenylacetate 3-hydroxylase family protein [Dehalococcoidia bacterium]|nr:4-hydroxyphenylacetate 3-hydroxylase family protein [Dehalococcoidia bacterium]
MGETRQTSLLTGEEYLAGLRDGRRVFIGGEPVADVTAHPAFRNAARSVARLYDALHDPAQQQVLLGADRQGITTHKFFMPSYSADELLAAREAIAAWARLSYGFMGRTPDYKAAFMATLGAAPEFYAPFQQNAERWYRRFAERALFLNHVLINPPIDRNKPVHEVDDVYVHVVRERDDGIIVSGAKMLATGSALTHATFVAQNSAAHLQQGKAEDYALVFIAEMNTPGKTLICRRSYEQTAESPWDNPLSSRFDENDAIVIFDEAFIPWENVLVYRDVQKATGFYPASGFMNRYTLQAGTRLAVKFDFVCGLIARALEANGTDGFRGVQAQLGELMGWGNLLWALTAALALDPQEGPGGMAIPKAEFAVLVRLFGAMAWPKVEEVVAQTLGGSPLVVPSSFRDLQNAELRPLIDRFYRGSGDGGDAHDRIKLFKLLWDAVGSEFGARHTLYERNYGGNHEQVRLDVLGFNRRRGRLEEMQALVESCLAEYDLDGWSGEPWR